MSLPLSIILPNYNHAHLIGGALESALSQTFTDFELIVIDDGSSDHSLEVIQSYLKKDSRIRIIQHEKNKGIAEGVKRGLERSQGKYIHVLSASDCYLPGFLEKSMCQLKKFPEIGLCFTDAGLFNGNPQKYTPFRVLENAYTPLIFLPSAIQRVFKYAHLTIPGLAAIIKRSDFCKHGGYREELFFLCDTILNQQIALSKGAIYIPETLVLFREPGYSKSSSSNKVIRTEALNNLREHLLLPEHRELLYKMGKAAVLGMMCKEQPLECLKHPRLWPCYVDLVERYLYKRMRRFKGKPLVSAGFLRRHSL